MNRNLHKNNDFNSDNQSLKVDNSYTFEYIPANRVIGGRKMFELPSGLDFNKLLEKYPLESSKRFKEETKPNLNRLKLLVDILYRNMETDIDSPDYLTTSVHSVILKEAVNHYSEYLKYLCDCRVLNLGSSYQSDRYSKRHTFNKKYFQTRKTYRERIPKPMVDRALEKANKKLLNEQFIDSHQYLFRGFYKGLYVDESNCKDYARTLCTDVDGVIDDKLYKIYCSQINAIKDCDGRFSISDKVNRLSTPITNLKSDFRKFLNYRGDTLVSLDIKNCQPYLMNILLRKEAITPIIAQISKKCQKYDLGEGKKEDKGKRKEEKEIHRTIMCAFSIPPILEGSSIPEKELEMFFNLTSSGSIYYHAHDFNIGAWGDIYPYYIKLPTEAKGKINYEPLDYQFPLAKYPSEVERGRACSKALFVRYIGGEMKNNHLEPYFKAYFPNIHEFVCTVKQSPQGTIEKDGYKMFSRVLQYLEAWFVLEVITREFCDENPEAAVFTIHDSITTQERFKWALKAKVEEVFTRYLPKAPELHFDPWCVDCVIHELAA